MEMDNDADFGTMEKIALGVSSRKKGEAVRNLRSGDAEGTSEETA